MKTLIRIIAIFIVLSFITSDCILAQNSATVNTTRAPESVPPTSRNRVNIESTPRPPSSTSPPPVRPPSTPSSTVSSEMETVQVERLGQLLNNLTNSQRSTGTSTGIRTGSENILVIPTEEVGIEELLTINEDMNVMTQIFRNELGSEAIPALGSLPLIGGLFDPTQSYRLLTNRNNTISSMYLQDYGALFMMQVDFPLSGPPQTQENQEETKKEDVDEVWQQTRQQIYQPRRVPVATRGGRVTERQEVEYDAQQVENLKTTLIQSLKHAANIRVLQPDESVIISITGTGTSDGIVSIQNLEGTNRVLVLESTHESTQGNLVTRIYEEGLPDDAKFSSPTVLVIRAKKSDIDAFAEGELDFDKFREKVQVLGYPLLGGAANVTPVPRAASTINYPPSWTSGQ